MAVISRKQILGGINTLGLKLFNLGAMFAVSVVLARTLGVEEYGHYVFVFTLVGLLSEPQFIGLRTLAVRHSSLYLASGSVALVKGLFSRLWLFSLVGALVGGLVLSLVALLMKQDLGDQAFWLCLSGAILPVFLGINRIRDGMLRGAGRLVAGQIPKLLLRPLFLLVFIGIAWLILRQEFTAGWAMAMQVLAALLAAFVYRHMTWRYIDSQLPAGPTEYRTRDWLRELFPLMLTGWLLVADSRIGILLLGVLDDTAESSKFHAAFRIAEIITLAHAVANLIIEPMIARHYEAGEMDKLQKKMTLVAAIIFIVTIPVALIMIFAGEWLLAMFGPEFISVAPALTILAGAHLIDASMGAVTQMLAMTNHAGEAARGMAMGLLINLGLCLILIPSYGAMGAAWGTLVSTFVYKVFLVWRIYRLTGIWSTPLYLPFKFLRVS
ncbi:polysaccharide biosynthesis C-terminal domain-containing protein [Oceanobacter mangrovi]|uniref:polysaccharide biosynthesis C-terminal domain-containing protein n=1 Tax=Oceanobacter mangrovi TaxID=2862510 RepID=UPI001C8F043B|nr:polysaccharide biosynthesis C-terminal domain-containing protein [Oceanobacter mangrovi]